MKIPTNTYKYSNFLHSRHVTDVIVIDFKKAFDTACHSKLLFKLQFYGIYGNLFNWIQALMLGRSQSVKGQKIYFCISASSPAISEVPQGSVLESTLFLLYINDVADIFTELTVSLSLFADDLKLYSYYTVDATHSDFYSLQSID